jgi:hypothetical protein
MTVERRLLPASIGGQLEEWSDFESLPVQMEARELSAQQRGGHNEPSQLRTRAG